MILTQYTITLRARERGYHLITDEVTLRLTALLRLRVGLAHFFLQHTSAALTLNENADPTVRGDFTTFFDRLVPPDISLYTHTLEGPDDMTSHIKTSLLGCSLLIPVRDGRLTLGDWQGLYLCEFRKQGRPRRLIVTLLGEAKV